MSRKNTFFRILTYIRGKFKLLFILAILLVLASAFSNLMVSLSIKFVLDDYVIPMMGVANPDFASLYRIIAVVGAIFIIGVLSSFLYTRIMAYVSQSAIRQIRSDMFSNMQYLPIRYTDENTTGSIMSLYTNDANTLEQLLNQTLPSCFSSIITVVSSFISMLVLSPLLSVLAVLMIMFLIYVTKFFGTRSAKYFGEQQMNIAKVTGFVQEHLAGQRVIKIFNHEKKTEEEFDKLNNELFESASKAQIISSIMAPVIGNIGNIQFVLTAVVGGVLAVNGIGGITIGVVASYLQLTKSFANPVSQICQQANIFIMAIAGANRIFKLIDEEHEINEGKVILVNAEEKGNLLYECNERTGVWAWKKADGSLVKLRGDVRFDNMTFTYDGKKDVLKNINLFAKPGQKLAFVGSTGAGKTTVTNLINRLYEVKEGSIVYDGIDIREIDKRSLRKSLGVVLQETKLFTGSIRDNIRYGRLDATDEDVVNAAKLAHADSFINMLPSGYDTIITENAEELSQGQKQLIAIARAAIADPPVLILDEATSSIDTRTESIVQRGMDNLMKGRTVFVIAHRLSTIKNSEAIIVLEHGEIIERGNHEELIKKHGIYYQLYTGKIELD